MKIEARKFGHAIALEARGWAGAGSVGGISVDLVPGIPGDALGDAIAHLFKGIGSPGDAAAFEADCRAAVRGVLA